jgi:hypothetical protein
MTTLVLVDLYEEHAEDRLHRAARTDDPKPRNLAMPWRKDAEASLVLVDLYKEHAEECLRSAARMDDPKRRDLLVKLAMQWLKDAEALRQSISPSKGQAERRSHPNTRRPRGRPGSA